MNGSTKMSKQTTNKATPAQDENEKAKYKREPPNRYEENPPKQQRNVMATVEDRID